MYGKKWWSTNVSAKLLSDLVIFSIPSSGIPLDFCEQIRVVAWIYFMYFIAGINTKQFWNIPEEELFARLRILNLSIRSFVNAFVDIALTFFDSSLNSFLFDVTSFSLWTKSVFFTKLAISLLLAKFACDNFAVIFFDVNLLNSWVVIYLSWQWSVVILFSISLNFVL